MGWWPTRGGPTPSPQVQSWFRCHRQEVAPLPLSPQTAGDRCDAAPAAPGPPSLCPRLQPPFGRAPERCWHPAPSPDCSFLQPPTSRSARWPCPGSRRRSGAVTPSPCTSGSRCQPCPGHAATPLWPEQGAPGTHGGRRPPAPLAPRTNLSSRSSLGRKSEPQTKGGNALTCLLSSSWAILAWSLLPAPADGSLPAQGPEAVPSGSASASPGAALCPSHCSPSLSLALSTPPAQCSPRVLLAPQAS